MPGMVNTKRQNSPNILNSMDFIENDLPLPSYRSLFSGWFEMEEFSNKNVSNRLNEKKQESITRKRNDSFNKLVSSSSVELLQQVIIDYDEDGDDSTKGRWTIEEHKLFLEGIVQYGKDWKKIQPMIKTRNLVQVRTHAQKVFKKVVSLKKKIQEKQNKN